jgi:hypothetical protein
MERIEDLSEPEQQALLKVLVHRIQQTMTEMGFEEPQLALLLFNDHREGRYIISSGRSDLMQALHEAAEWLEHRKNWRVSASV